ncbi:MAG: SPOR domain-containing protein [Ideonella sp.]
MKNRQFGGFGLGLIVGLLSGLALALAVALYVTKVPIPFVNKVPQRASSDRDAEEKERNRNWDPNAPLHGNNPVRQPAAAIASAPATTAVAPRPDPAEPAEAGANVSATNPGTTPTTPAEPRPRTMASPAPATTANPMRNPPAAPGTAQAPSDSANRQAASIFSDRPAPAPGESALSTKSRDDPFIYYVQAGAYGRQEDAEQQRAKLAIIGLEAKVTEREQAGRTVFRVRVGPFDKRERADETKARLTGASIDGLLVRVQK